MGLVQFHDPETDQILFVDTFKSDFRNRYAQVTERVSLEVSQLFKQLKIDSVDVQTGKPYIEAIVHLFKRRALRH